MKRLLSLIISLIIITSPVSAYAAEFGIDVSHNNETVDFVNVKSDGMSFVMIRLGYYNTLDKRFWENVKSACDAGLEFGVYLYSYAYTDSEAKTEANFVLNTLKELGEYSKSFTLPVAYDIEDEQLCNKGKAQITRNINIFCSAIEGAGYVPMVYSNLNFFNNYIDLTQTKEQGWKIWLAKWESQPDFSKKKQVESGLYADIWQYKKGDVTADGNERYDRNIAYDLSSLRVIKKAPKVPSVKKVTIKKLTSSKRSMTVKWGKIKNIDGYQIQYSLKKNFKSKKTLKIKSKYKSKTIKKLKAKKKYYVRVRAYKKQNKKTYYGKWSKIKAVKIKK